AVVERAQVPWRIVRLIAERLVARGPLGDAELAFVKQILRDRTLHHVFDAVPDLVRAFAGVPEISRDLAFALTKIEHGVFAGAVRVARGVGGEATEALFEAWVGEHIDARRYGAIPWLDDDSLFRRAVRVVLATRPADRVISLYFDVDGPEQAAMLLDE